MGRSIVPQCYSSRVPPVTSRQNPIVGRFRAAARREAEDVLLLDGVHLVADALDAGTRLREAAVGTDAPASRTGSAGQASSSADGSLRYLAGAGNCTFGASRDASDAVK